MNYIKKHSNLILFLLIILLIGLLLGIILGLIQSSLFKNDLIYSANSIKEALLTVRINNVLPHIILLGLVFIMVFIIPLYFINIIYLLFKGISIGFNIYLLTKMFGFSGFLSALIYNIATNLFFLSLLIFLFLKSGYLMKNLFWSFLNPDKVQFSNLKKSFLALGIISIIIIINDLFLYFASPFLLPKIFYLIA